jgi:hypothetical protein
MIAALASHLLTDALPHGDYLVRHGFLIPNRYWPAREFIASLVVFAWIASWVRGRYRWLALFFGLMGGLPALESLLIGIQVLEKNKALFPTHNGLIPHGKNIGVTSMLLEFGSLLYALSRFVFPGHRQEPPQDRI